MYSHRAASTPAAKRLAPDDKLEQMPHVRPVLVRTRWWVGQPLLSIGVMYDSFVERALEPWSFGIYASGRSILIGLASTDLRAQAIPGRPAIVSALVRRIHPPHQTAVLVHTPVP